ncbi:gluconolaconase [Terriglobus tenax]|uniref:gluconolaconase n=1 Tax=Terriglobus tenax TaxID=1111115 RepID=UPI0021E0C769|nr:gluconolaconase [Terriglobus tenax]
MAAAFRFGSNLEDPRLDSVTPLAALPHGEFEVHGSGLGVHEGDLPTVMIGDVPARLALSRESRISVRVPEGTITGDLVVRSHGSSSNPLPVRVAVPMTDNLHPVANPAVDAEGNVYATLSGQRNQQTPVSIFRIDRDFQVRPFVRDLMNATGLAFGKDGYLYSSSRAEGIVYRISPAGAMTIYAEGMGVATGIAFDEDGNLFVGDRSGTIFKIDRERQIFVYATLEPSVAAYHLTFDDHGTLFVTGPTTSSRDHVYAINRHGEVETFYTGLGRPQGSAFDTDGNLYVAASLNGQRGIVRITPRREASLVVSGSSIVGFCFLEDGCAAIATNNALYHVELGIEGRLVASTNS